MSIGKAYNLLPTFAISVVKQTKEITMNKLLMALIAAYCAVSMVANVCSCRILDVAGLALDGGSFMFPLIFVIRDLIHKKSNLEVSKVTIIACAACNAFMFASFAATAFLPADPATGAQVEFGQVLLPSGRIMLGSIISLLIVELIDAFVYEKVSIKHGKGIVPAFVSNLVSIPLDSAIIAVIGFYGDIPNEAVLDIFVLNIIIKLVMTTACLPLAKKRRESKSHVDAARI